MTRPVLGPIAIGERLLSDEVVPRPTAHKFYLLSRDPGHAGTPHDPEFLASDSTYTPTKVGQLARFPPNFRPALASPVPVFEDVRPRVLSAGLMAGPQRPSSGSRLSTISTACKYTESVRSSQPIAGFVELVALMLLPPISCSVVRRPATCTGLLSNPNAVPPAAAASSASSASSPEERQRRVSQGLLGGAVLLLPL